MNNEKYTVLVVDDDRNNRNILQRYLSKDEFLVLSASGALEAYQILDLVIPDAILMDYQMPKLNGLDAIKEIRSINKRTAIILMTAYSSQEVAIEAIRSQADDFLPKPLNFAKIPKLVKEHIISRRELFPPHDYVKKPIKENLFTHFLLMKDSLPIYSLGKWTKDSQNEDMNIISEHDSDDETLISGFISAIKSFSSSIFGQNLGEISMGSHQLLMRTKESFVVCLTISVDTYRWMLKNGLLDIIENTLDDILDQVTQHLGESYGYKEGNSFLEGYINSILKQTSLRITTMV